MNESNEYRTFCQMSACVSSNLNHNFSNVLLVFLFKYQYSRLIVQAKQDEAHKILQSILQLLQYEDLLIDDRLDFVGLHRCHHLFELHLGPDMDSAKREDSI